MMTRMMITRTPIIRLRPPPLTPNLLARLHVVRYLPIHGQAKQTIKKIRKINRPSKAREKHALGPWRARQATVVVNSQ